MSVSMRLTRVGGKKDAQWRIVVADRRSPRDGRFIETLGRYNPQPNPSVISVDEERVRLWLDRGAVPSETVRKLLKTQGIGR
jgi:small subunit ribosomal protein S16